MSLLWPVSLVLLGLLPLIVVAYIAVLRRRRRFAVAYSSLSLVRAALPAQSRVRRYLPPALFLLAVASLVVALARPAVVTTVPAGRATIILTLDVSQSMGQWDIYPSRLQAAENAALTYVNRQQANNQIGIVAFASIAQLVQVPTTDAEQLAAAIERLTMGRGTAIGSGILEALDAIAQINPRVAPSDRGAALAGQATPGASEPSEHVPDIIVLLTDGSNNAGPDPLVAAQQAVERGVRIYTIGYGTNNTTGFGGRQGNGGFGGRNPLGFDEEGLKQIAAMTGGQYYSATSANELQKVFKSLPVYLITRKETTEITVAFAGLGALLAFAAVAFSQIWHPLP